MAWGVWRVPESELSVLGRVEERDVFELGCGAAQWTTALAGVGARAVGLDLSDQQLTHARAQSQSISLVQGDAECLPFRGEAFDIVFCDHGAMVFASPEATIPQVSRVLRPAGLSAFCIESHPRQLFRPRGGHSDFSARNELLRALNTCRRSIRRISASVRGVDSAFSSARSSNGPWLRASHDAPRCVTPLRRTYISSGTYQRTAGQQHADAQVGEHVR